MGNRKEAQSSTGAITPILMRPESHVQIAKYGLQLDDTGLVTWKHGSPFHPRNWSFTRKIYDTTMVLFLEFWVTVISNTGADAGQAAQQQLNLSRSTRLVVFTIVYFIGQLLAGIVLPPYSESFGRKWLYVSGGLLYGGFSVIPAVWPSVPGIVLGRFGTGVASAVPSVLASGSIEDMWNIRDRVWIFLLGCTIANMGMCLSPIVSPYIISAYGWEWIFYISTIVCAVASVFFAFMRESRPSLILRRIVNNIQKQTGDDALRTCSLDYFPDMHKFLETAVLRPIHLFFTEIIIFCVALLVAATISLIYLFAEVMPGIFEAYDPPLGRLEKIVPWLALASGLFISGLTRLWDFRRLQSFKTTDITPEHKLISFAFATPCLAIGLWWFAWTVPAGKGSSPNIAWGVPAASLVFIGWALNEFDMVLAGYLTDTYNAYASSAFGAMNMVRCVLSAVFPLVAPRIYSSLGNHWAGTVLASAATTFCIVPPLFLRYGAGIRGRSKFAMQSLEASRQELADDK